MKPWKDPIVEEVRRNREKLFAEFDNDPEKLFEYMRKKTLEHPERIADLKPVKPRKVRHTA